MNHSNHFAPITLLASGLFLTANVMAHGNDQIWEAPSTPLHTDLSIDQLPLQN